MDVINENHIQPKKIDTEFIDFLNSTFLNSLDPDELVFNESDLTLFETLSQSLVQGLRMNSASYVDTISEV